jgi:putative hydrolase of HD superfamily
MNKAQNVIEYYVQCNTLKNVIRTGWKNWNIKKERLESVAEHIFGVQMLAIAMYSEYNYDIDIKKVITMLALHELEEIIIGDLTLFDISKKDKEIIGHDAINKVVKSLKIKDDIKNIILEFDSLKTKEARFAFYCDKLEADIQSKLYDEEGCVDINNQQNNKVIKDKKVQKLLQEGKRFSGMWILFGQERYGYDDNFKEVSKYVLKNKVSYK